MTQKPNNQRTERQELAGRSIVFTDRLLATTLRQWLVGILGSWTLVWLAGPLVLNSILLRVLDPALGVNTLRPGDLVRWRTEGWADTRIGPHGLPGWQSRDAPRRIVLWGDSQVEGVCVDDAEKIHNQLITYAHDQLQLELDCLPMGRSGADARDWQDLMDEADPLWDPTLHVWIVTDLSDLLSLVPDQGFEPCRRWTVESPRWVKLAAKLRAEAVFAAGNRILRDPGTGDLRRLRFAVGPQASSSGVSGQPFDPTHSSSAEQASAKADAVVAAVVELKHRYKERLAILYAPPTPTLGQPIAIEHPDDLLFDLIHLKLVAAGIEVIDMRESFVGLWFSQRRLPRGFHNGVPGYGHLNADGNRLIAQAIASLARERLSR
jgi:hypothetical protein